MKTKKQSFNKHLIVKNISLIPNTLTLSNLNLTHNSTQLRWFSFCRKIFCMGLCPLCFRILSNFTLVFFVHYHEQQMAINDLLFNGWTVQIESRRFVLKYQLSFNDSVLIIYCLVQWFPKFIPRTTGGLPDKLKWSANHFTNKTLWFIKCLSLNKKNKRGKVWKPLLYLL